MNKEEIENMKEYFNECIIKDTVYEEDLTLYYMQIAKEYINYLEQKETILDKVTDKLKEDAREEEGYIKWLDEKTQEIVQPKKIIIVKSDYARSILNIIEGEKNNGK